MPKQEPKSRRRASASRPYEDYDLLKGTYDEDYSGLFDESTDLFDDKTPAKLKPPPAPGSFDANFSDAGLEEMWEREDADAAKPPKRVPNWFQKFQQQYGAEGQPLEIPETFEDPVEIPYEEPEPIFVENLRSRYEYPKDTEEISPRNVEKLKTVFGDNLKISADTGSKDRKSLTEAALKKYPTAAEKRKADTEKAMKKYPKAGDRNKPLSKF